MRPTLNISEHSEVCNPMRYIIVGGESDEGDRYIAKFDIVVILQYFTLSISPFIAIEDIAKFDIILH